MNIKEQIKNAVLSIEPDAEVFLFGSRARGDFKEDSDWDILVLLPGEVNFRRKFKVIDILHDIELEEVQAFGIIVRSKNVWSDYGIFQESPFYKEVQREKVLI